MPSAVCHVNRRPAGGAQGAAVVSQKASWQAGKPNPAWLEIRVLRFPLMSHAQAADCAAPLPLHAPTRVGMQVVGHELLCALLQLAWQVARGRRRRLGPHAASQHLGVGGRAGGNEAKTVGIWYIRRRAGAQRKCVWHVMQAASKSVRACGRQHGQLRLRALPTCTLMSTSSRLPCRSRCALKSAIFSLQPKETDETQQGGVCVVWLKQGAAPPPPT